ncbi:MAG TPA: tetratricopeptide repeat protein [Blastocatellia bacterium]|nr:tetratricopeptide repeat protein [Blastocatellia bacterium]
MYTLVTFATHWGSKHGGINSFNADFLAAFGIAYHLGAQVICIVASDTSDEKTEAAKAHVQLVPLPYTPEAKAFGPEHGQAGVEQLRQRNISFDPDKTVCLGHDRITGAAAVAAAKLAGGRSAVIHHMSYDHYESYAENSASAQKKTHEQTTILQGADLVLAVGPLLRDAAGDRLSKSKPVHMLIPGLAEIDARQAPATFVAFLSGRLSDDAARIKQGHLGVAAFATAQRNALESGMPEPLLKQPKLLLRGVDFEGQVTGSSSHVQQHPEAELKRFAEEYAQAVVNLHALPYTEDRQLLYSELSGASVALMPSWHEGFGLVAWEAIAAGVPLIISRNSGVYRLLEEKHPGAEIGYLHGLDIRGAGTFPFFHEEDLKATVTALNKIANNPGRARQQAAMLKNMLDGHTWVACAERTVEAFEWGIEKGSVPATRVDTLSQTPGPIVQAPTDRDQGPLRIPVGQWRAGAGMAESQLLRAEEALLPFDPARQSDVEDLKEWLDDTQWPISVRLITGAGGQGKTRLALELCQQRVALGWSAGFLDSNLEANRMTATWKAVRNLDRSLLIVIDYAETRQLPFLSLLEAALQNSSNQPVRILLLARDGGEWWDNLPSKNTQCEALLSGYATTGPFRLKALYPAEPDRREAYSRALNAFAHTLGVSVPEVLPDLLGEHFERPLYVQIAALLALYGERPTSAQGLTKSLLNHERRYWLGVLAHLDWPEPERRAETLLALTTLAGGFAIAKAAETYWFNAKGKVLGTAEFNSMFRNLATLYPGTQGLQALRPDLLGEALVAQALLRPEAGALLDAVLSNTSTQSVRRNALTVLARLSTQRPDLQETLVDALSRHFHHCCRDIVAVGTETTGRLPELAELAFSRLSSAGRSQTAGLLSPLFEEDSVQLAGLAYLVCGYLTEKLRERFEKKPGDLNRMSEFARALLNYAVILSRLGRYDLACAADRNALELYRRLVVRSPRGVEPLYAQSLDNYAIHLSNAGKDEEALEYSREALEIQRRLAQVDPDRFEPGYARSLGNYAIHLGNVGKGEEALDHARKSLAVQERLTQKNTDLFEPDYAFSLSVYADRLSDVGKHREALEHENHALAIFNRLVQKNPDRFERRYASSLISHAIHLSNVGQSGEALRAAREALEIHKRLAQKYPDRFAISLFSSICSEQFLAWLCDQSAGNEQPHLNQLMMFIVPNRRYVAMLFSAFVNACVSEDRTVRKDAFRQVFSHWTNLSMAEKMGSEPYWLCAAAWCATFEAPALVETDWEISWRQFVKQRSGSLPRWMLEVARRLGFQWPE